MSSMEVIRYGSQTVASLNLVTPVHIGSESDDFTADPLWVERNNAPSYYAHSAPNPRELRCEIGVASADSAETTRARILAFLGWPRWQERDLVVEMTNGEWFAVPAVVKSISLDNPANVSVVFETPLPWWEGLARKKALDTVTFSDIPASYQLTNLGQIDTPCRILIGWSAQHTNSDDTIGWKYHRTLTLTNDGDKSMQNYAVWLPELDSADLIAAGKCLAGGGDVRIFFDGVEQPRLLRNWGSVRGSICVVIEELAPGEEQEIELVYGNLNATPGEEPSLTDGAYKSTKRPAFDYTGVESGVSSATTTVITTPGTFVADQFVGGKLYVVSGTGSNQSSNITANTTNTITVSPALSPAPNATSVIVVEMADNTFHTYRMQPVSHNDERGGWFASAKHSNPSTISFDTPHAWRRTTVLQNADDYNQPRISKLDVGGGTFHYFPIFNATRRRGQDRRLKEEGTGDGVSLYNPFGFNEIQFDYKWLNINGRCLFQVATKEDGGEAWSPIYTDSTTQATLTAIAKQTTSLGGANHVSFSVQPVDGVEISTDAKLTNEPNGRWNKVLRVTIDTTNLDVGSWSAEAEVYDLQAILHFGGGSGPIDTQLFFAGEFVPEYHVAAPYDTIRIGRDGARVFLESSQKLAINGKTAAVEITNSTGGQTLKVVPNRVKITRSDWNFYGSQVTTLAPEWLVMRSSHGNIYDDPGFETGISGWTNYEPDATHMTATPSWVATDVHDGTHAMRVVLTQLNPSPGDLIQGRAFARGPITPCTPGQVLSFGAWAKHVSSSGNPLRSLVGILLLDDTQTPIALDTDALQPVGDSSYVWGSIQYRVPDSSEAAYFAPLLGGEATESSQTGTLTIHFDDIAWMPNDITVEEDHVGTLTLLATYLPMRLN